MITCSQNVPCLGNNWPAGNTQPQKKSEKFWPRPTKQPNQMVLQTNKKHVGGGGQHSWHSLGIWEHRKDYETEAGNQQQPGLCWRYSVKQTDNTYTYTHITPHSHTEWVTQETSDAPFHLPTLASGAEPCSVLVWWASAWEGGSQCSIPLLDLQPHGSSCRARPHQQSDPQTRSTHDEARWATPVWWLCQIGFFHPVQLSSSKRVCLPA